MCHVLHSHTIIMILCKCCATYLLNDEILLFIQTWPSRQKRAPGDRTRYSAARQRAHSNDVAPFETTRLSVADNCVWSYALRDLLGGGGLSRPWSPMHEETRRASTPPADAAIDDAGRKERHAPPASHCDAHCGLAHCGRGLLRCPPPPHPAPTPLRRVAARSGIK